MLTLTQIISRFTARVRTAQEHLDALLVLENDFMKEVDACGCQDSVECGLPGRPDLPQFTLMGLSPGPRQLLTAERRHQIIRKISKRYLGDETEEKTPLKVSKIYCHSKSII